MNRALLEVFKRQGGNVESLAKNYEKLLIENESLKKTIAEKKEQIKILTNVNNQNLKLDL